MCFDFNNKVYFYILTFIFNFLIIIPQSYSGFNSFDYSKTFSSINELAINKHSSKPDFTTNPPVFKLYGPLSIDMNNIRYKNSIFFVPVLNDQSKPLILAIYCTKSLINVKGSSGWKGWSQSYHSFENNLLSKLCDSFN